MTEPTRQDRPAISQLNEVPPSTWADSYLGFNGGGERKDCRYEKYSFFSKKKCEREGDSTCVVKVTSKASQQICKFERNMKGRTFVKSLSSQLLLIGPLDATFVPLHYRLCAATNDTTAPWQSPSNETKRIYKFTNDDLQIISEWLTLINGVVDVPAGAI